MPDGHRECGRIVHNAAPAAAAMAVLWASAVAAAFPRFGFRVHWLRKPVVSVLAGPKAKAIRLYSKSPHDRGQSATMWRHRPPNRRRAALHGPEEEKVQPPARVALTGRPGPTVGQLLAVIDQHRACCRS